MLAGGPHMARVGRRDAGETDLKLSWLVHLVSILLGILGALALSGAWVAGERGALFGLSQAHLFGDAIVPELMAIAASICTLVRLQLEGARRGRVALI